MRSGVSRRALLGLWLLVSPALATRQPSRFTFVIPPGWADLTDGASDQARLTLNQGLVEASTKGEFLAFAADLQADENGRNSFLQAVLLPAALAVNVETLPQIRDALRKRSEGDGLAIDMQSVEISRIGDVDVARARWIVRSKDGDEARLAYVIPGGSRAALLIYGCPAERFEKLRPLFQTLAEHTQGAEAPAPPPTNWKSTLVSVMQVSSVLLVLGYFLTSRKKSTPKTGPKGGKNGKG